MTKRTRLIDDEQDDNNTRGSNQVTFGYERSQVTYCQLSIKVSSNTKGVEELIRKLKTVLRILQDGDQDTMLTMYKLDATRNEDNNYDMDESVVIYKSSDFPNQSQN